jgi:spore germination protein
MIGFVGVLLNPVHVSAWMVPWNPKSLESFEKNASKIKEVIPEFWKVEADGSIVLRNEWEKAQFARLRSVAKKNKVLIYGMVSNYVGGFEPKRVHEMLKDPKKRDSAVRFMVESARTAGIQGIDLDLESLKREDRDAYSAFVKQLYVATQKAKLKLSVTVHPKTEEPGNWDGPMAQDWKALGTACDVFRIMCYDFSWAGSMPGSIAPTEWVVRVAKFALNQVPKEKVDIGVAWYGYRWKDAGPADTITFTDLGMNPFREDPKSGELIQQGTTYFSGSNAFEQKIKAMSAIGIKRVSAWYIGSEDPDVWRHVR